MSESKKEDSEKRRQKQVSSEGKSKKGTKNQREQHTTLGTASASAPAVAKPCVASARSQVAACQRLLLPQQLIAALYDA